tara:strand:- start:15 stop:128 length:114 start_codon:yes stop_codon:yes gene_type:complete
MLGLMMEKNLIVTGIFGDIKTPTLDLFILVIENNAGS